MQIKLVIFIFSSIESTTNNRSTKNKKNLLIKRTTFGNQIFEIPKTLNSHIEYELQIHDTNKRELSIIISIRIMPASHNTLNVEKPQAQHI